MKYQCGLDFGTSNTAIAISDIETKKNVFLESDSSLLYFPPTNDMVYSVGKKAASDYVNEEMQGRLLKSIKSLLKQNNFTDTWIFGKKMSVTDLVTLILKDFKLRASKFLNNDIESVVLGRPALFSEDHKKEKLAIERLVKSAKDAGFKNIKLQLEPIAAALTYETTLTKNERVLVVDIGGGTTDFTIMDLSQTNKIDKDRQSDIISYDGVYVGGDLFDSEIMWHKITPHLGRGVHYESYNQDLEIPNILYWELRHWERSFLLKNSKLRRNIDKYYNWSKKNSKIDNVRKLIDNNLVYSLFKEIERSKIELSKKEESSIFFNESSIDIQDTINLNYFSEIIKNHISKIDECLLRILNKSNLSYIDIDSVFITGGSSPIVPIKKLFIDRFGSEKIKSGDNFESIAYGLSIS